MILNYIFLYCGHSLVWHTCSLDVCSGRLWRSPLVFHRREAQACWSGQLGGRMWSGPKTRGLHHTVPLQTLDHFFNKWYDLSDFSDPGANQSKLLQHVFLLHYIGEHVSVDSGADSTGKTVFSSSQYQSCTFRLLYSSFMSILWLQLSVVSPRWSPANCPLAWRRWCPLRMAHSRWRTWARRAQTPGRGTSVCRATTRITVAASWFTRAGCWHRATASPSKSDLCLSVVPQWCSDSSSHRAGDVVILGAHDLNFMSGQTAAVESVQSLAHDSKFPPVSDLSMIRLSVPARIGIMWPYLCFSWDPAQQSKLYSFNVCSIQGRWYFRCV